MIRGHAIQSKLAASAILALLSALAILGPIPSAHGTTNWVAGIKYTNVPTSGVAGLDVEISTANMAFYSGSSWVAVPVTLQIKDGCCTTSTNNPYGDVYILQSSVGFDTTNGLEFGYSVWDIQTSSFTATGNSAGHQSLDNYWLRVYYDSANSDWVMAITDDSTSTVVYTHTFSDVFGGTTARTSDPNSCGCNQNWAAVESPDSSTSSFPSTPNAFDVSYIHAQYGQYSGGSLGWTSLTQVYDAYTSSPPSNIYIKAAGSGTYYQVGSLGSGYQSDNNLLNI